MLSSTPWIRRLAAVVAGALTSLALAIAGPSVGVAKTHHVPCGKNKPKHAHVNCGKHKGQLGEEPGKAKGERGSPTAPASTNPPGQPGGDERGKAKGEDKHHPDK